MYPNVDDRQIKLNPLFSLPLSSLQPFLRIRINNERRNREIVRERFPNGVRQVYSLNPQLASGIACPLSKTIITRIREIDLMVIHPSAIQVALWRRQPGRWNEWGGNDKIT